MARRSSAPKRFQRPCFSWLPTPVFQFLGLVKYYERWRNHICGVKKPHQFPVSFMRIHWRIGQFPMKHHQISGLDWFIVFMFQWSHTKCHWQIADSNYPQHCWLRTLAICHWSRLLAVYPIIPSGKLYTTMGKLYTTFAHWDDQSDQPRVKSSPTYGHTLLIHRSPRPCLTNVNCSAILSHVGVVSCLVSKTQIEISISVIIVFRIKVTTWNRVISVVFP